MSLDVKPRAAWAIVQEDGNFDGQIVLAARGTRRCASPAVCTVRRFQ